MTVQSSVPYFDIFADEWAARYDEVSVAGHALRARRARLLELLDDVRGAVLDVGCGSAVIGLDILARNCQLWGIDASPRMIAECQRQLAVASAHFNVGDAQAIPFPDGRFDAVLSLGVIDRLADPNRALAEMGRVLRPGGVLLVAFPNFVSPYALWRSHVYYPAIGTMKTILSTIRTRPLPPGFISRAHLWTEAQATRTLARLVGPVDGVRYYSFGALLSPLDEWFPKLALRVARRLEPLRDGRMRWLGAGFIVRAIKSV